MTMDSTTISRKSPLKRNFLGSMLTLSLAGLVMIELDFCFFGLLIVEIKVVMTIQQSVERPWLVLH